MNEGNLNEDANVTKVVYRRVLYPASRDPFHKIKGFSGLRVTWLGQGKGSALCSFPSPLVSLFSNLCPRHEATTVGLLASQELVSVEFIERCDCISLQIWY